MGPRRRSSSSAIDVWPVVADAFLAFLAVVIVLASSRKPVDRGVAILKSEIAQAARTRFRDLIDDVDLGENWTRLVFTDSTLSFEACQWDLPDRKQIELRELFSWIGRKRNLLRQIRIEGHADQRWEGNGCPDVGPFQDNLQLSQNRARAVYNVLLGLPAEDRTSLQPLLKSNADDASLPESLAYLRDFARHGTLEVAGFGDRRPRDPESPSSPKNRRVEVVLEFREAPPAREGTGEGQRKGAAVNLALGHVARH